jgi:AcrR family transcriptional regulator
VDAVTVADLAAAAGVSRMTLHRRGIGKDEVLEQLGRRLEEEQRDALVDVLAAGGSRARAAAPGARRAVRRRRALPAGARGPRQPPGRGLPRAGGAGTSPSSRAPGFTDGLRRLLADGRLDGSVHVEDPELMATLVYNAVGHTYRHMRMGHRWSAADARRRVVDLIVDGLPGPGRPA